MIADYFSSAGVNVQSEDARILFSRDVVRSKTKNLNSHRSGRISCQHVFSDPVNMTPS
jgi:hypothetical protein